MADRVPPPAPEPVTEQRVVALIQAFEKSVAAAKAERKRRAEEEAGRGC